MAGATFSQTVAVQLEKVRPKLEMLIQQDSTLFNYIKDETEALAVSGRATRIPFAPLNGGKFLQINADGGDMGLGTVRTTDAFTLTPVYFANALQWSKQTEVSTKGDKAIINWFQNEMANASTRFAAGIEAALQGDGSNTLDTVVSASGSAIVVNNANQFQDGQDILVFSALGGTNRTAAGPATILSVDAANKTLNLTAAIPAGTTAGDLLLVNGSSGSTTLSGLNGVKYFQLQSNTGTLMGIARSTYPGKISTPHVNANNAALTPAMGRRALAQVQIALGVNAAKEQQLIFHMNLDQLAAWENIGLAVAQVQQLQVGKTSADMLAQDAPKTMAGRPIVANINATPGRIDGLCLKNWGRVQTQKPDLYEVGNQTLFPAYGTSGGVASSTLAYIWAGFNLFNANPRAGVYIDNLPVPVGY